MKIENFYTLAQSDGVFWSKTHVTRKRGKISIGDWDCFRSSSDIFALILLLVLLDTILKKKIFENF